MTIDQTKLKFGSLAKSRYNILFKTQVVDQNNLLYTKHRTIHKIVSYFRFY